MWTEHLRLVAVWILFFGSVTVTAIIGDMVVFVLLIGIISVFASLVYAIHVTYEWLMLYVFVGVKKK